MTDAELRHWEKEILQRTRYAVFEAAFFDWLEPGVKHLVMVDATDIPHGVWEEVEYWRGEPFL